jgi:hypothetical protein
MADMVTYAWRTTRLLVTPSLAHRIEYHEVRPQARAPCECSTARRCLTRRACAGAQDTTVHLKVITDHEGEGAEASWWPLVIAELARLRLPEIQSTHFTLTETRSALPLRDSGPGWCASTPRRDTHGRRLSPCCGGQLRGVRGVRRGLSPLAARPYLGRGHHGRRRAGRQGVHRAGAAESLPLR